MPTKKQKKYQAGGTVEPNFPMENPAVAEANKMGQELKSIPLESIEPDFPTSNAADRSQTYQLGGAVKPPTAPSISSYKKGGEVDITDLVKKAERQKEIQKIIDESPSSEEAKDYYKKGYKALYESQIKKMKKKVLKKKRWKQK
tara:strand:- start:293 stop:724 length:432 start_codon:yes stop_codon:yes gene_type:complete